MKFAIRTRADIGEVITVASSSDIDWVSPREFHHALLRTAEFIVRKKKHNIRFSSQLEQDTLSKFMIAELSVLFMNESQTLSRKPSISSFVKDGMGKLLNRSKSIKSLAAHMRGMTAAHSRAESGVMSFTNTDIMKVSTPS